MKSHLLRTLPACAFLVALLSTGIAFADDPPADGGAAQAGDQKGAMLASLSAEDKAKYVKARRQVLASNPDLKAEQESLAKQHEALKSQGDSASAEDRKALFQSFMAHQKKMKAAMLQVDPSLGPVFDQIEQNMKDRFQKHAAQEASGI